MGIGLLVSLAAALAASAVPARAQEACGADIQRFCKDVEPGEGRVVECLEPHAKELAPACRVHHEELMAGVRENRRKLTAACGPDIEASCAGVPPGLARVAQCLRENFGKLSDGCKAFQLARKDRFKTELPSKTAGLRETCKADAAKFCAKASSDDEGLSECLYEHHKDLATACRGRVLRVHKAAEHLKDGNPRSR